MWAQRIFSKVSNLAGVPIISADTLQRAWPQETFGPRTVTMETVHLHTQPTEGTAYAEIATRYLAQREHLASHEVIIDNIPRQIEELIRGTCLPPAATPEGIYAQLLILSDIM